MTPVGAVANRIGAVENSAYQTGDWTAQLETVPTIHGERKHRRSWKQRLPNMGSERVYLFLESTIVLED